MKCKILRKKKNNGFPCDTITEVNNLPVTEVANSGQLLSQAHTSVCLGARNPFLSDNHASQLLCAVRYNPIPHTTSTVPLLALISITYCSGSWRN